MSDRNLHYLSMSRRVDTERPNGGSIAAKRLTSAVPLSTGYHLRGASDSKVRNPSLTTRRHRESFTPTQPTPCTPARSSHDPSKPTSTRKISASFSTRCRPSGHPTTAFSTATASTTMDHPGPLTSHPVRRSSGLPTSQSHGNMSAYKIDRTLRTSDTYSNLPLPSLQYRNVPKSSVESARSPARVRPDRRAENIPPSASMSSLPVSKQSPTKFAKPKPITKPLSPPKKEKEKPRLGIQKSRTFNNVMANLTASLSRNSLSQFKSNDSRHTSISSKDTLRKTSSSYSKPRSIVSSTSTQTLPRSAAQAAEPTDPRLIHTAQNSAYWAGRFMALQDRFQSETLTPDNMNTLIQAQAERSMLPVTQPSLASSATTSCIPAAAGARPAPRKTTHAATISTTTPRKPVSKQRQASYMGPTTTSYTATASSSSTTSSSRAPPPPPSYETATSLSLVDEDIRARRIFQYLDSLCLTSEARFSLYQWQQAYARRVGKECLLPGGGTMQSQRGKELTWVGRLLMGSGGGGRHQARKVSLED